MLRLNIGARSDEQFHLHFGHPLMTHQYFFFFRRTKWIMGESTFTSYWIWKLQFYHGTAKVDGTRTYMYWAGKLDDGGGTHYIPNLNGYVLTTKPKELLSLRWRRYGPSRPTWDNMGGS